MHDLHDFNALFPDLPAGSVDDLLNNMIGNSSLLTNFLLDLLDGHIYTLLLCVLLHTLFGDDFHDFDGLFPNLPQHFNIIQQH